MSMTPEQLAEYGLPETAFQVTPEAMLSATQEVPEDNRGIFHKAIDKLKSPFTKAAIVAGAGTLVLGACGGDDDAVGSTDMPPVTTTATETTDPTATTVAADGDEPVDTVSDLEARGMANDEAVRKRLRDTGMDEDLIAEIVGIKSIVEGSADKCVARVDSAMSEELTVETEHGAFIRRENVQSAGILGGLITNGGVNQFTDSVSRDYKDGEGDTREEVAEYFAQGVENDEIRMEALQEAAARLCADPYSAASGAVMIANAELGNSGVRLGEIFTGLEEYVVDGERTEEAMDEKYEIALEDFLGEPNADNEDVVDAYYTQQEKAATMAAILESLGNFINNGTITIQESTVAYGATEDRVTLRHSKAGVTGNPGQTLGGQYESERGESLVFTWESKAGCIVIDGLTVNMLDGRYGYTAFTSSPDGCEPVTVVTTTPGTSVPPKPTPNPDHTSQSRPDVANQLDPIDDDGTDGFDDDEANSTIDNQDDNDAAIAGGGDPLDIDNTDDGASTTEEESGDLGGATGQTGSTPNDDAPVDSDFDPDADQGGTNNGVEGSDSVDDAEVITDDGAVVDADSGGANKGDTGLPG